MRGYAPLGRPNGSIDGVWWVEWCPKVLEEELDRNVSRS